MSRRPKQIIEDMNETIAALNCELELPLNIDTQRNVDRLVTVLLRDLDEIATARGTTNVVGLVLSCGKES